MSLKTASAILRGKWLVDKEWANAHMPLVYAVIKGEAKASMLFGDDDDDEMGDDEQSQLIGKNVYSVFPNTDLSKLPNGSIAYLDIDGPLLKLGDMCSYGSEEYAELMYGLMCAPNIAGVIIDMDSPGGQADGTATFSDAIRSCDAVKPVIGFVDDGMAASAAYWDISSCREVYCCQPTDAVGSIGVYVTIADWKAYYASVGLQLKDVYAPQSKDKNLEVRESLNGNDEPLKEELSFIADAFIGAVKKNRKGKLTGNDWATGKMFFAADAQKLGLIDGIKSFDQVVFRLNRLISAQKNSNNNTMAFEKTLTVAKTEAFEVVDGGFLLSEENLNNIEANIASVEAAATTANDAVTAANTARDNAVTALQTAEQNLTAANSTIGERDSQIQQLSARISELEAGTSKPVQTHREKDATGQGKTAFHLSENDPSNQIADNLFGSPAEKK